jgi:hypothetical protein
VGIANIKWPQRIEVWHTRLMNRLLTRNIERCRQETPPVEEIEPGRFASCHRARELDLSV